MRNWLENFAYRIGLEAWIFLAAAAAAFFLLMVTLSFQTIKAAASNPADILRYE